MLVTFTKFTLLYNKVWFNIFFFTFILYHKTFIFKTLLYEKYINKVRRSNGHNTDYN